MGATVNRRECDLPWRKKHANRSLRGLAGLLALALFLALVPKARAAAPDPWFGRDKALHFGATFTLASGGYAGTALFSERQGVRAAAGAGLGLGAGIAKEIYDRYAGGDASFRDLTWDVAGTATGVLVSYLLDRYVF
jgi:putative lipoprotein